MYVCELILTFGDHLLSWVNVHGQLRWRGSKGEERESKGDKERGRGAREETEETKSKTSMQIKPNHNSVKRREAATEIETVGRGEERGGN